MGVGGADEGGGGGGVPGCGRGGVVDRAGEGVDGGGRPVVDALGGLAFVDDALVAALVGGLVGVAPDTGRSAEARASAPPSPSSARK